MNAVETHRTAFRWANELLEMTMADVTPAQAAWTPPGTANPLGATYAHAICGADATVQSTFKGEQPLFETAWVGKTGVVNPQLQSTFEWAHGLRVDLTLLREYAKAVYANADAYLADLTDEELIRHLDLTREGMGVRTLDWALSALLTGHLHDMTGEISVLKGIQGGKGYPF